MQIPADGRRRGSRLGRFVAGAAASAAAYRVLRARPPGGAQPWTRTNYRGRRVTLLAGPAYAGSAGLAALVLPAPPRLRAALAVATLGAGFVGGYDDLAGHTHAKGLRGHLGALSRGEVTSGTLKILGVGATGVVAGSLVGRKPGGRRGGTLITGALIAGTANLVNLLDLRPGRALKVGLVLGVPLVAAGGTVGSLVAAPAGAAAGLLPADLTEDSMLGDAGANALGAMLGTALAARLRDRPVGLGLALATVVGLTLASERVSFSAVIDASRPLRWLDGLGRVGRAERVAAVSHPLNGRP